MLKKGTRAIVQIGDTRTISVRSGQNFNVLDYGISSLSNDFDNTIKFVAALEDAKTPEDVLAAAKRYYRFRNQVGHIHLVSDY